MAKKNVRPDFTQPIAEPSSRYRQGMLQAKEEISRADTQLAAEKAALVEADADQVQEQDIDDLLGWTNALNFDE